MQKNDITELIKIITKVTATTIKTLLKLSVLLEEKKEKSESEIEETVELPLGTQVGMAYDITNNTITIGAPERAFDKKYLKYLLQHLNIPDDVKIIFEDK